MLDPGEACDDGSGNSDTTPNACRNNCAVPSCGDGVLDDLSGEGCDDGTSTSDTQPDACRTTCAPASCGDTVVDTAEDCDASNLDGATCSTLGFSGGNLSCHSDCTFDPSNCYASVCGNGTIEGAEECDLFELGGETCQTQGFHSGILSCTVQCTFTTVDCSLPPTMTVGGPCLSDVDCNGGICLTEVDPSRHWGQAGGYCYEPCDQNNNCPLSGADGVCVHLTSADYCMRECDQSNPVCGPGQACEDIGGVSVCFWARCTSDSECVITGDCDTDQSSSDFGWCITPAENCSNTTDDDYDGKIDCSDPECTGDPNCPIGEICGNSVDDDGDGAVDCDDGECSNLGICTGQICTAPAGAVLTCGDILTGEANNATGSTDVIEGAECVDPETGTAGAYFANEHGPEYAYVLTVTQPQEVTLTLSNYLGDLDVYVIKEILGACDAYRGCFAWGGAGPGVVEVISFTAYPGMSYYVVVDGFQGNISTYDIAVACASTGFEDCGNSTDDDGDSLVDCDDPECWGVAGCTTETDCSNGEDEDLDGATDCTDSDCAGAPGC